jgi:hypothetical protein
VIGSRALAGATLAAGLLALSACSGGRIPPSAAVVEGRTITQDTLADEVATYLSVTPDARTAFEAASPSTRIEDLNRNALAFLIQQDFVDRYAEANGIQVDGQQVRTDLENLVADGGGRQEVDRQLAQRGLTEANLLEYQRQLSTRSAVATALDPSGDQQAQNQAFGAWLLKAIGAASIDVNPRFGALDRGLGQLLPISSTADLG